MKIFDFNTLEDVITHIEGDYRPREYIVYIPYFLREMHPDQFYVGAFGETRLVNLPYVTARFYPEKPLGALEIDYSKVIVLPVDEKPVRIIYEGEEDNV